ncbi:uncharacterized protein Z520_10562 [Fonsecaea multimorphosa CBS 102226]|uniref:60S ribosomal subunit assembly/export protein LOC1 n=1 Tax=Fonsecaea multimorphosa CBS 102226 TaxID=1442371 RepID=A0A0D2I8Z8_9EURO|nr:uncharacterized protein Z520_10562 [Fonsecaea multimorphosa CBS 102226]KIX93656.1 hypothetical protein Z520_10562 [Fonsecaea multimorphosa CBS 102226]OAL19769.1 hypothetical protein AYO22_09296 [Fonsecaea multimorphosa]
MAPKPPSSSKSSAKNPKARKSATTTGPSSKKSKITKRPPPKQVKTRPGVHSQTSTQGTKPSKRKNQKTYTDKDLNLPALNMITPVSAPENPTSHARKGGTGKKKNKIYIDDEESMRTILAMVNAEKEGQIESKLIKARQMEEIREARRKEMEKRKESKREELEGVKKGLKKGKKAKRERDTGNDQEGNGQSNTKTKTKKRVSFA